MAPCALVSTGEALKRGLYAKPLIHQVAALENHESLMLIQPHTPTAVTGMPLKLIST